MRAPLTWPATVLWALLTLVFGADLAFAQGAPGFYRTRGVDIIDPSGAPVILKGVGVGGWLMPEGYMLQISAPDGGSPRSIRARIQDLIGPADTDRFFEIYEANYVEEKDVAAIAGWGYDHIRLPFHFKVLYDQSTGTFREAGFAQIDTFIEWCRKYGLEVILDLHATPGAQNSLNISDSDGTARLWTEPVPYQDQTVAIWAEIARRYKDEKLIIGYDLINEPVTPQGNYQAAIRNLYVRLAQAVRAVDPNHILFIEGNHFATDFSALTPPFDSNMVYTFHKYWNGVDRGTIQYLLDLRATHQVPLWLGETGENSNAWFYAVRTLAESNGISWNWWMHKKIETTSAPLSAPFAPGYEALVRYWRNSGPRPSAAAARSALFAMAEGLDLDSCDVRPGVVASLFDPAYNTAAKPFKDHVLPGLVNAADYDAGNQGVAYADQDFMTTSGSPGGGNSGGQYRNDGVDIEASTDPQGFRYSVGFLNASEYLTYTVRVETAGKYDVEFRVASVGGATGSRGAMLVSLGGVELGAVPSIPNTGGWQTWTSTYLRGVTLPAGTHALRLFFRTGGFNLNRLRFTLVEATGAEPDAPGMGGAQLLGVHPNPSRDTFAVTFTTDAPVRAALTVFDVLGREVYVLAPEAVDAGTRTLTARPGLSPGTYLYRLLLDDGVTQTTLPGTTVVIR